LAKNKPVLITAAACADLLLTLDRRNFRTLLGQSHPERSPGPNDASYFFPEFARLIEQSE
jgi:carbamoylphosphate synthase small subunit